MRTTSRWFAALVALVAVEAVAGQQWKPADQPDLPAAFEQAQELKLEPVADGPDTCWVGPEWWVPNPDGKTWDAVLFYYPSYMGPHEVYVVDFGTGKATRTEFFEFDKARAMFHLVPYFLINGRLLIKPGGPRVCMFSYDPAANDLKFQGFPVGEEVSGDGGVAANDDGSAFYGVGRAPKARTVKFYTIDTDTMKGRAVCEVGPEQPNMTWEYFKVEADGDWVYAAVGCNPWRLYGANVKTGKGRLIAETGPIIGDHKTMEVRRLPGYPGCDVFITGMKGEPKDKTQRFWLRNGELTPREGDAPPWAGEKFAAPRPTFMVKYPQPPKGLERVRAPVDLEGKVRYWYRLSGDMAQAASVKPDEWQKIELPVKLYPAPIRRMAALPDGSLFALTEGYGRAVRFNPRTGERATLGPTMSVCSLCVHEDRLYLCGYPSSQVWIYDPARPWTVGRSGDAPPQGDAEDESAAADSRSNPAKVAALMAFTKVHMPFGGAVPAADGRVYFGGKIVRIGNGGGLGWWDVKEGKAGGFFEPFSAYQVFWMCSACDGRYILCSTKPVEDDAKPGFRPQRGRLFVYDTTAHQMLHQVDHDDLGIPGYIIEAAPGRVLGYSADQKGGVLYGFDPAAGKVLWTKPVPNKPETGFAAIRRWNYAFTRGPDGLVWATMGGVLARINPADATVHVVGKMPDAQIVFLDGDVYVAGGEKYRRIAGIPKVAPTAR
jgi:outer membrane protein assembly factor BamB